MTAHDIAAGFGKANSLDRPHTGRLAFAGRAVQRALSAGIYTLTALIGVLIFLYPFLSVAVAQQQGNAGMQTAGSVSSPFALALIIVLCLAALIVETQGQAMSAKLVALLGVLIAMNSVLRMAETAFPGPGGFTPIFLLIILSGYVFGARFGFLMGALSMLVSALFTAGIGPWLPYQMFTAGWMGMSAGWLGNVRWWRVAGRSPRAQDTHSKSELAALIIFGALWGLVYGAIMNLWFWPFQAGSPEQSWQAGLSAGDTLQRYLVFYVATSLTWDAFRAAGNVILLALFGIPTLKALLRFKRRFLFETERT